MIHVDFNKLAKIPPGGGWRLHGRKGEVRGRGLGYDYGPRALIPACVSSPRAVLFQRRAQLSYLRRRGVPSVSSGRHQLTPCRAGAGRFTTWRHPGDRCETQATTPPRTPPVRATVFVGRWPDIPVIEVPGFPAGKFSPTTATLVTGATEAVLIDALYLKDDVRGLGDLIERTGKKLTTIYVTHAHQDHYLGIPALVVVVSAGDPKRCGGSGPHSGGGDTKFAEHRGESWAVAGESGEQKALVQRGRCVVPAVAERVAERLLEVRRNRQVTQRSAGPQVPTDLAGVKAVNGVGPELPLDLLAELVEVDPERREQGGWIEPGPIAATRTDDKPHCVAWPAPG